MPVSALRPRGRPCLQFLEQPLQLDCASRRTLRRQRSARLCRRPTAHLDFLRFRSPGLSSRRPCSSSRGRPRTRVWLVGRLHRRQYRSRDRVCRTLLPLPPSSASLGSRSGEGAAAGRAKAVTWGRAELPGHPNINSTGARNNKSASSWKARWPAPAWKATASPSSTPARWPRPCWRGCKGHRPQPVHGVRGVVSPFARRAAFVLAQRLQQARRTFGEQVDDRAWAVDSLIPERREALSALGMR